MQTATKEGEHGGEHGSFRASGGVPSPGLAGPVLAAPAPAPPGHAGAHRAAHRRHRHRARRLAGPGPHGHARRVGQRRRGGGRVVGHDADAGEPGEHERPRRQRHEHQRGVPRRRRQQPVGEAGLRRGQGVQRADPGDPPLREPDQRQRWHQRPQDQPDHRPVRPDQRRQPAVVVPAVDPGQPRRLRGRRRHRHLDRGQPALRRPTGPDPAAQRLVDHDQLDQPGLALPVVDRPGHGARPLGRGAVGGELGPPGPRQEGGRRRVRPGGRPGGPQRLPAAGPEEGGHHADGRDRGRQSRPDGRRPTRTRSWPWRSSSRPACSPSSP